MSNESQQIRVRDSGTTLEKQILNIDGTIYELNDCTVLQFKFQKPNGEVIIKDAELTHDGLDGKVKFTTQLGDFDRAGTWRGQVYFERGGVSHHTNFFTFRVYPNL